jgi:hypothetical protein
MNLHKKILICQLLAHFFVLQICQGTVMGVVWNIYKGLRVWFRGGDLHIKRITTHD